MTFYHNQAVVIKSNLNPCTLLAPTILVQTMLSILIWSYFNFTICFLFGFSISFLGILTINAKFSKFEIKKCKIP